MPAADDMKELVPDRVTDDIHKSARGIMRTNLHIIFLRDIHDIHMCPLKCNRVVRIEMCLCVAIWIHSALAVTCN